MILTTLFNYFRNMKKLGEYLPEDKMLTLISDDYRFLQVLSRFGIPLGFGDSTIKEVCDDKGVDCHTFLTVVNFINNGSCPPSELPQISLQSLLHYLKQSHVYFLEFFLPAIRKKIMEGIIMKDTDVSFLILKLFDEYVAGVADHMQQEERSLFILMDNKNGLKNDGMPSTSKHHVKVGSKLKELKNIILKYCPSESNANILNAALYDIYRCEEELASHCLIEDLLLLPALTIHNK